MSKDLNRDFHVLIPAAGNGARTGLSTPKQYCKIAGKTVLRHTIEKFLPIQGLKSVRVIIDPDHIELYRQSVIGLELAPPVIGSSTRKQSVSNGLSSFSTAEQNDLVLIHDAARPFVSTAAIQSLLDAMQTANAATVVTPVADTLVDTGYQAIDRNNVRAVQTPQAFTIALLKNAHDAFRHDDRFTDDAGLIAAMDETVTLVQGNSGNFKITTADDLAMAERLLTASRETRTGMGYDVHAFAPEKTNTAIRIGGVDIAHDHEILAHSDGDVALHALTDAILGTIGEGDIGQLFPPSDPQWKNADSTLFVKEAVRRLAAKGGHVVHADITIICEAPKIGPHRAAIQSCIAGLLNIDTGRVGLKATTSESLGFTGRREGLVAQAVVTVSLPAGENS